MYILTNAAKNLLRNKKRNAWVAGITSCIMMATVISLTIVNTTHIIIDEVRMDIASRVDISVDLFSLGGPGTMVNIDLADYQRFAQAPYLSAANLVATMPVFSDSVFAIGDESFATTASPDASMANMMTMQLIGASDTDLLDDFGDARYIVEGRMAHAPNEVVISMDLAVHNSLYVGDTITIETVHFPVQALTLEVVGVYVDYTPAFTEWWLEMFGMFYLSRRNELITVFDTFLVAGFETDAGIDMQSVYFLNHPDDLAAFEAYVRALGLPDIFGVTINQEALDKVTGPIGSLAGISQTFGFITLGLGAVVLLLLSYMQIQERRQEVGVLRAMGMKKWGVAAGVLSEILLIASVCVLVGLGVGNMLAQPVAEHLLAGEVAQIMPDEGADDGGRVLFSGGQMQTDNAAAGFTPISDIELSLSQQVLTDIALAGLGLSLASSLLSILSIVKQKPLDLLN